MTFTKLLPDNRCKEVLEHVKNNISHYEKPSLLMEALVNDAGAKDLLDFYRLIEMSPGDVDSLEVTTSEVTSSSCWWIQGIHQKFSRDVFRLCKADRLVRWHASGPQVGRLPSVHVHHITTGVTLGIYQGPYPSILHFLCGFHQAI
jgi:hypothetical protein